jgi:hypothetical protein
VSTWKSTPLNRFGLYKKFWTIETRPHDPDRYVTSEDLREASEEPPEAAPAPAVGNLRTGDAPQIPNNPYFPFPNWSSFRLGDWYWDDRREKGRESFQELVEILTCDDFHTEEIRVANWDKINGSLAASEFDDVGAGYDLDPDWFGDGSSWRSTPIPLEVPFNRTSSDPGVHTYEVPNFRYRPLVPIITERLKDPTRGDYFHVVPSDLRWQPQGSEGPDLRIYGELYNSPAFLEAYKEIQVSYLPLPTRNTLLTILCSRFRYWNVRVYPPSELRAPFHATLSLSFSHQTRPCWHRLDRAKSGPCT